MSWRRPLSVIFFLIAEALLWFIALCSFATVLERGAFRKVADAIARDIGAGDFLEPDRAHDAQVLAERAAENAIGGPALFLVVAVAIGAFGLMRLLAKAELPVSSRAAIGLLVSFAAIGLALQVELAEGSLWEGGLLADLRGEGGSTFAGEIAPADFVANPDLDRVRGASRSFTILGVSLIWLRFLFVGRAPITFERSLRNFGVGFGIAVVVALLISASDAEVASWLIIPYFFLGVLSLVTAHAARAPEDETALSRDAPWAVSVLGTLLLLMAFSVLLIGLSLLEIQSLLEPFWVLLLSAFAWVLVILITPIFWVAELLINLLVSEVELTNVQAEIREAVFEDKEQEEGGFRFPSWIGNVIRALIIVGAIWVAYLVGRWLFARSEHRAEAQYAENRVVGDGGSGLGSILRALIPKPARHHRGDWNWLEGNRVYQLYGRMLVGARLRGVHQRPGQTALEFGAESGDQLEAPAFAGIAQAFDKTRYGRHESSSDLLQGLEQELEVWEQAHPLGEVESDAMSASTDDNEGAT